MLLECWHALSTCPCHTRVWDIQARSDQLRAGRHHYPACSSISINTGKEHLSSLVGHTSRPTRSSASLRLLVPLLPWTCSPPLGSCTVGPWDPHVSCRCVSITFCLVRFGQVFKPVKILSWRFAFQHHSWFCVSPWIINCVLSCLPLGLVSFSSNTHDLTHGRDCAPDFIYSYFRRANKVTAREEDIGSYKTSA